MIDIIYIIVSKEREKQRYEYLIKYFEEHPCKYKIEYIEPYYKNRDENKIPRSHYSPPNNYLSLGAIMLSYTYEKLFEHIINDTKYNHILILESDVLFHNDFYSKLDIIYDDWVHNGKHPSVIFLGNGCNLIPSQNTRCTSNLYLTNKTKCTDSMLFDRDVIIYIYNHMLNMVITKPVDHLWESMFGKNIFAYWIDEPLVTQGSQNGKYLSSIQPRTIIYIKN